jgi:hypothetical protein
MLGALEEHLGKQIGQAKLRFRLVFDASGELDAEGHRAQAGHPLANHL